VAEEYSEIITGAQAIIGILRPLIDSQIVCKMGFPRTKQSWITLVLEIRRVGNGYNLLIDRVPGFEKALSNFPDKEVSLEFTDKAGVPCWFHTKVIAHREEILSELPGVIYRIQRRQYFRIEASLGTEITFLVGSTTERKKATVKNYSTGGLAFFMEKDLKLSVGDLLTDIHLNIPEGAELIRFQIPKAAIRRIEPELVSGVKALCASEFLEIGKEARNNILSHVFRQPRIMIGRVRMGPHR
jgi:c-di-GMP-binding flagellar brake protein YcgR